MKNVMRYIHRTARLSEMYRNERLKPYELAGIHHTYILNICRNPGVSQEELADIIFVNKSNVTRQLSILEKKGYVTREKSPTDGRKSVIYPTEKAKNVYPEIVSILQEWNNQLLEGFSEEEKEILSRSLPEIMNRAKQAMDQMEKEK